MGSKGVVWGIVALTAAFGLFANSAEAQRRVDVSDADGLRSAIEDAMAGDEIVLADGTYALTGNLRTRVAGSAAMPVVVRAANPLMALIQFDSDGGFVEGFVVQHDYWTFTDLRIEGVCSDHSRCEHAWHVVAADGVVIRGCEAFNFNAQIKGNGNGEGAYPDDALIEANHFHNTAPRQTGNPVTPIDVVGGRRWILRANYIHDFEKAQGDRISYAAFLKGTSREGVIEQNLVVCAQDYTGGVRLGLSFGGGGSNPDRICEGGDCSIEHIGGVMRNNIILHCSDVGIYINECQDCDIAHNTLYATSGIDFRFATTDVRAFGNLHSGRMRDREGATSAQSGNLELSDGQIEMFFADPAAADFSLVDGTMLQNQGMTNALVMRDYCGNTRDDGFPDMGAVEFDGDGPCDTRMPGVPPAMDAGVTDAGASDAGVSDGGTSDAGTGEDAGAADAGVSDGGQNDGGVADGGPTDDGGGCSSSPGRSTAFGWGLLGLVFCLRRRRGRA